MIYFIPPSHEATMAQLLNCALNRIRRVTGRLTPYSIRQAWYNTELAVLLNQHKP